MNLNLFAIFPSAIRRFQRFRLLRKEAVNLAAVMAIVFTSILFALLAFAEVIVYFIWKRFDPIGSRYLRCIQLPGIIHSFFKHGIMYDKF